METKISATVISTLTVELHVIKIGNKQMTTSVFNQLYEEDCFDKEYNILYPIWGKVHTKDGDFVIFQKDNTLRKRAIWSKGRDVGYFTFFCYFCYNNRKIITELLRAADTVVTGSPYITLRELISEDYKIDTTKSEEYTAAINILDKNIREKFENEFRNYTKQNKMLDEFNNSIQIFIAL